MPGPRPPPSAGTPPTASGRPRTGRDGELPRLARALVRLATTREDRDLLLADLAERFREIARAQGSRAARRWYRLQALGAVPWAFRAFVDRLPGSGGGGLAADLRAGARSLARRPLWATGVAGTLGLGIAAALLTFAVAWAVWLAPMPWPAPDRVVRLYEVAPPGPGGGTGDPEARRRPLSVTLLEELRARSWRTLEAVSAALPEGRARWATDGELRSVSSVSLSPGGFALLGIVPTLGRLPVAVEMETVLSERFWRTAFGSDPNVVGTPMTYDWGTPTIVGVARFPGGYPDDADAAFVVEWPGDETRDVRFVDAIARIRPGFTTDQARAELDAFLAGLAEVHPEHRGWRMDAVVLADALVEPFRPVLALLLAAGVTFLLLAAANVLGLVAARGVEGVKDRRVRVALGASEGRLLAGAVAQGLALALPGAAAGAGAAVGLLAPLRRIVPQDVPRLAEVTLSPSLLLAGLALGAALGAVTGAGSYLAARGAEPGAGRRSPWRAGRAGGRRALLVGQVALTTLLTAAGAAILDRVSALGAMDLGFAPEGVSTTSAVLRRSDEWTFTRAVLDAFARRGVLAAAAFNGPMAGDDVPLFGMTPTEGAEERFYEWHPVSPRYFQVMGTRLLAGRDFGPDDHASAPGVAIVSEAFVQGWFGPGTAPADAVGRRIGPLFFGRGEGPRVVGVVESVRHDGPAEPVTPEVYTPLAHFAIPPVSLLLRGAPEELATAVADVLAEADPELHWSPLVPYASYLREWFAPLRLQLVLTSVLGGLGLLLASLGLYALMAYQVSTRRRELGVRKAVGASDGRLVGRVLAGGAALTLTGTLIGLAAWYRLLPWTRGLLEGLDGGGPEVPLAVTLVVGGSGLAATLLPALRVARVDPAETLRAE